MENGKSLKTKYTYLKKEQGCDVTASFMQKSNYKKIHFIASIFDFRSILDDYQWNSFKKHFIVFRVFYCDVKYMLLKISQVLL